MSYLVRAGSTCLAFVLCAPTLAADVRKRASDQGVEETTAELSVAPMDHLEYPEDRPSWIDNEPQFGGDTDIIVVVTGPCESAKESADELKWMQRAAIAAYVTRLTGLSGDEVVYSISDEEIESELVSRGYEGTLTQGDSTRFETAVELRFDETRQAEIQRMSQNIEVGRRLGAMGVLGALGLILLVGSSAFFGLVGRRFERRRRLAHS